MLQISGSGWRRHYCQGAAQKRISDKHSGFQSLYGLYARNSTFRMKSALTVVLFRLFTIGVFVDGKEASIVSVMEGDSVTLKSGVTDVQTDFDIEWRFKGKRIDKFVDGLQLDSQTGDLKISNIRTTDSGLYKVKISSPTGSSEMEFNVKVVSADEVKLVSVIVNVGGSVPLHTDVPDIQGYDVIRWRFGQQTSPVAEINRTAGIFNTSDGPDGIFRDRLQLDHQTGSLTITNITTEHAGLYEAEINRTRSSYTTHHTRSFNVTVRGSGVQSGSGPQSDSGMSPGAVAGIVVAVVLLAAVVGVVVYYRRKISELKRQREENGVNLNTKKTDDPATEESKLPTDS